MQQNIEHPENEACYEGLAVNKGIEQPDPVNPAIAERLKHLRKKTLTADEYVAGILRGDINILSQAITLVESARVASRTRVNPSVSGSRVYPGPGKVLSSRRSGNSLPDKDIKLPCLPSTRVVNVQKGVFLEIKPVWKS